MLEHKVCIIYYPLYCDSASCTNTFVHLWHMQISMSILNLFISQKAPAPIWVRMRDDCHTWPRPFIDGIVGDGTREGQSLNIAGGTRLLWRRTHRPENYMNPQPSPSAESELDLVSHGRAFPTRN